MADLTKHSDGSQLEATKSLTYTRSYTCKHGTREVEYVDGEMYACPTANCVCCGHFFGWIDSGHGGNGTYGGTMWVPLKTCSYCGGHSENFGDWSGVSIMDDSGKFVPAAEYDPKKYDNLPTAQELIAKYQVNDLQPSDPDTNSRKAKAQS